MAKTPHMKHGGRSKLGKLYSRGDPAESAYLLTRASAHVKLGDFGPTRMAEELLVAGTLEYYLPQIESNYRPRLLDLLIDERAERKVIPFDSIEKLEKQFDFGFQTNVFIARLLEITNAYFVTASKRVARELRGYHLKAIRFASLLESARRIGNNYRIESIIDFTSELLFTPLYLDGALFSRDTVYSAVQVPSMPLSEFVERHKKNSCLCREGSHADFMFVLLRGKIGVTSDGKYIGTISGPGEAFGELGLFLDQQRTATLTAEENTDVYVIKKQELKEFHAGHRDFFANIAKTQALRVEKIVTALVRFDRLLANVKDSAEQKSAKRIDDESSDALKSLVLNLSEIAKQEKLTELQRLLDQQKKIL